MAIYTGVDGVMRELKGVAAAVSYVSYEIPVMKCGVDGVVRDLLNIADRIDHVEIRLNSVSVDTIDSNCDYVSNDGTDMAAVNRYGSLEVGSNSIQVTCTTGKKRVFLNYWINIVYKDGISTALSSIIQNAGATYTLSVMGYVYFSTSGWYQNVCLDNEVVTGYVSSSKTNTISITDVSGQTSGYISAALEYSGTSRSKQTFNSIYINGKSIPITVVNELS